MAFTQEQQQRIDELNVALRKPGVAPSERRALGNELADLLLSASPAGASSGPAAAPTPAAGDAAVPAQLAAFADRIGGLLHAYRWDAGDRRLLSGLHGDALRLLPDGTYVAPLRVQEAGERPFAILPASVSRTLSDPHSTPETRAAAVADLETAMGVSGGNGAVAGDQAA